MKKITSTTQFPVLKNAVAVDIDRLKSSGELNHGHIYSVDDTITFPDTIAELDPQEVSVRNSQFKALNVRVLINDEPAWLPVGNLRRRPVDAETTLKPFKLNHELFSLSNDYDRCNHCIGKTIKVIAVEELDFVRYTRDGSLMYDDNGHQMIRKARLPIFAFVE